MGAGHAVQGDAEFGGVGFHLANLRGGQGIGDRHVERRGRDGMIHRGDGALGTPDLQAALAQAGKGLGGGHFVDEMQVDIQNGRSLGLFGDDMRLPDFFKECFGHDKPVTMV
jgi:hypothetical protein